MAVTDGLTSDTVKARARELGFDVCGVAPATAFRELRFLREWLDRGYAGQMQWLHRTADRRADVRATLPSARSVVVVGVVYNVDRPYSTERGDGRVARISRYAWGADYHDVLGGRLAALRGWMADRAGDAFEAAAYVDTGPVQERVYAQYAGLGWIGKNTCLINAELGSWMFLGAIVCSAVLTPDRPGTDQCGTCMLCLEACPTGALVEPHVLDATRCLSYLTIELRGAMPDALREAAGAHVFGCDICQDVCPWNLGPGTGRAVAPEWQPRPGLDGPALVDLWRRTDRSLGDLVRGTPLTRPRLAGLRRNLAVAMGNSGDATCRAALDEPIDGPSGDDPNVAEHVAWAKRRFDARGGAETARPDPTDRTQP